LKRTHLLKALPLILVLITCTAPRRVWFPGGPCEMPDCTLEVAVFTGEAYSTIAYVSPGEIQEYNVNTATKLVNRWAAAPELGWSGLAVEGSLPVFNPGD
jgi:hypothetical protein